MFKKNLLFASVFLFAGSMSLFAQSKLTDTVALHEVVIAPSKQSFNTGYTVVTLSAMRQKEYASSTLTGLLSDQTGIVVNSYGPVGLSSLSIRGTSSNHTAVVWNGINLQSTMNGGVNLSLMSCMMFDQVSLQMGGSSALYGSGAVGGVLFLNNTSIEDGLKVSISQYMGSFGTSNSMFSLSLGNGKFSSSTKFSYFNTENNFTYYNTEGDGRLTTVKDASQNQWSLLQGFNWKANANNALSLYAWILGGRYHVAQTMLQAEGSAYEDNHNNRVVAIWEQRISKFTNMARLALVHDEMHYVKSALTPWHMPTVLTAEYESKAELDANHSFDLAAQSIYESATSTNYADIKSRKRVALTGAYKQASFDRQLELGVNARGEWVDGSPSPFTASAGLEYKPTSIFSIKSSASRNFRLPTFNDLYWNPGGNPNLKPEDGWSADLGFTSKLGDDNWSARLNATGFSSWVKNMIIWLPGAGGDYSPQNFDQVWSRGVELGLNTSAHLQAFSLGFDANYSFTRSSKMKDGGYSADQMIYIPKHKISLYTYISYHRLRLSYTQKIESIRLYTESIVGRKADQIDGYGLGNLALSASFRLAKLDLSCGAKANNIWNASYQVMPWYPMPMRNYMLYLSFEFGH